MPRSRWFSPVLACLVMGVLIVNVVPAGAQTPSPSPSPDPETTPSPSPSPTQTPLPVPTPTPEPEPEPEVIEPKVSVSLSHVKLFGKAVVKGRVRPRDLDTKPKVRFRRNGKVVKTRKIRLKDDGRFRTSFYVSKPGSHRAEVVVNGRYIKRTFEKTGSHRTATPALSRGASGGDVKRLEKRLLRLGYYIPKADRYFGVETADALIAFHKVQRTARINYLPSSSWHRLASPIKPKPRYRSSWHFEVDQTRQVAFIVKNRKVRWIVHTSTGAGGATRDGTFTVHRKVAGYSPGRLYYPSYWDGLRAFHGWPEVPTYPASHGCARLPMWAAQWMYGKAQIGDRVHVYH